MEHSRTQWRLKQRYGNQTGILEPYYDVVDDQEMVHNVLIQPARPIDEEREYADRDLPRSSSAQSLSSGLNTDSSHVHPTYPPRKTTAKPAPSVNRDMKPGRRKHRAGHHKSTRTDPPSRRCPPSPCLPPELVQQLSAVSLQEDGPRRGQKLAKNGSELKLQSKGYQTDGARFSIDLEDERWSNEYLEEKEELVNFPQYQHEWPQTKVEIDQHHFIPMEKPQSLMEDDWYIGPCSRTDAEHALHLVNKDGAFLVRDCSLNSHTEPLVLSVYHEKKVYNVKIRFIENYRKYALGTGQRSNEMFDSVADIIKFHSIFPVVLISGKTVSSKCPENCVLMCPLSKRDVDQLLQS